MQSRLIVRNFGPIKFVDLDLRNVNVFIGPQASGKSALAKLYTIFKAPRKFLKNVNNSAIKDSSNYVSFKDVLDEYNIISFLKPETEIEFHSELHVLSYKNIHITYEPKLLKRIWYLEKLKENFETNRKEIISEISALCEKNMILNISVRLHFMDIIDTKEHLKETKDLENFQNINEEELDELIVVIKEIEANLSTNACLYIPSERNFVNIIKKASLNLLLNNVPIPKHILSFGAELEKVTPENIDLSFLHENLMYKSINGEDRIFTDKENNIKLTEAASGIQSVLPILIPILSHSYSFLPYQRSFVIEEPELNLFPLAQYELIKLLESVRKNATGEDDKDYKEYEDFGTTHTYTTHSPYILSALNNLLYANKIIASKGDKIKEQVKEIISVDISPLYFTAYQINNGAADSIFDRETGLIKDNYIDAASDKMTDDFDALMELMK